MTAAGQHPRLYSELAHWWPLLSPPSHYEEEAAELLPRLLAATDPPPRTLLELGCGGGSLASHLKGDIKLTLTDRSAAMLAQSQRVNPECEHALGDMRSLDLGRLFDLVLIHDAIDYATDETAVRETLATASRHLRSGGALFILPDHVRETFKPGTRTGGEDGPDGRALRYLEWTWDPDPTDCTYSAEFAFILHHPDGTVTSELDPHVGGLFSRDQWTTWIKEAGFTAAWRVDQWDRCVFECKRPR
ncbi:MAG: class I SAM-dependent methyltransferase [Chloroflexota bacterium]